MTTIIRQPKFLETASLRCLQRHWPSLGIHRNRPETHVWRLRAGGEIIAKGDKSSLETLATKFHMEIR